METNNYQTSSEARTVATTENRAAVKVRVARNVAPWQVPADISDRITEVGQSRASRNNPPSQLIPTIPKRCRQIRSIQEDPKAEVIEEYSAILSRLDLVPTKKDYSKDIESSKLGKLTQLDREATGTVVFPQVQVAKILLEGSNLG